MIGIGEDLVGTADLDELTQIKIRGAVGNSRCLLQRMRHDGDGEILLEFVDQILDPGRRDRI